MLENALDWGISEYDFWNMTLAELFRAIESKQRIRKFEEQEKASYYYILGELFGRSMARLYSSEATYPEIYEVFPALFNKEEIEAEKEKKQTEANIERLTQFAQAFNKKFNKEASN